VLPKEYRSSAGARQETGQAFGKITLNRLNSSVSEIYFLQVLEGFREFADTSARLVNGLVNG
jgi:hypothetical protein